MHFSLLTIADCPNDAPARELFALALQREGIDPARLIIREVATDAEARDLNFHGSPTFTINGQDLFPSDAEPAVCCRVYRTEDGLKAQPEVAKLQAAVRAALAG